MKFFKTSSIILVLFFSFSIFIHAENNTSSQNSAQENLTIKESKENRPVQPNKEIKVDEKKVKKFKTLKRIKEQKELTEYRPKGISQAGASVLTQVLDMSKNYSQQGTVFIEGIREYKIRKDVSKKLALKWAKEVKGYFLYWLNYWGINPKFIEISSSESKEKGEYIKIIFEREKLYTENDNETQDINKIITKMKEKSGVEDGYEVDRNRFIKIDAANLFEYNSKNLKYGASFVLDNLVDIIRVYNSHVGIKIQAYRTYAYKKGSAKKNAKADAKMVADYLGKIGLAKERMYVSGNEGEDEVNRVEVNLYQGIVNKKDIKSGLEVNLPEGAFVPVVVYTELNSPLNSFSPSGWMGDVNDLRVVMDYTGEKVFKDNHSMKITYLANGNQGWSGLYWQYPNNNWGNMPGSRDLRGAKKLIFWARGERGGERISEFKVGGIKGAYSDSDVAWLGNVVLTNKWEKYEINLNKKDMSHIIGGFCFVVTKYDNKYGCTFYLDEIRFE
jgi:hypothetical protein